ncbi:acetyltransferase [Frankia sp. AgB1.9]|uniref:acetyltransferase n=1 Tax=unclassified Frankia TaxID=2632575 RepID=UPI0019320DA5|nr:MULTISPECIES: acetyltransferase [unclassified Frankia]MBL7494454.1 acetyltransferase [Frankia sp. AgW1.1]MBL7546626.1 acetyltransferase [Frankia sp. AgB1.9]MBL7622388.1 acetyltransferase [Frankia sp. AgB1.8]
MTTSTTPPAADTANAPLDVWAIVELMGRVRRAGRVREVTIAGAGMIRLDVPAGVDADEPAVTQFLSPAALYAITPVAEDVARAVAIHQRPEPVHSWELPQAPAAEPSIPHVYDEDPEF